MTPPHPSHHAAFWDERFQHPDPAYGLDPSRFLVEQQDRFQPGMRVLAAADGQGRNALWLAEQGCEVTCADLSTEGLARAHDNASRRGLTLTTVCTDLIHGPWPAGPWDAVIAVYFHLLPAYRPRIHRAMANSLTPGGTLVIEGFHRDQFGRSSGGPRDPDMLFTEAMLADDFHDLAVQVNRHDRVTLDEGRLHQGPAELLRFCAVKPAEASIQSSPRRRPAGG